MSASEQPTLFAKCCQLSYTATAIIVVTK